MDPLDLDQWGDEFELYLAVRKTVGLSTVMGTGGRRWGYRQEKGPFWERLAAALASRWPPREGCVFVVGPIRPEPDDEGPLLKEEARAPISALRLDDVDRAKQHMKDLYSDALQGRQASDAADRAY